MAKQTFKRRCSPVLWLFKTNGSMRQLYDCSYKILFASYPAFVTFAPSILKKENFTCTVNACFIVAGSEFKLTRKTAKDLPLGGWMPVTIPT